MKIDCNYGDRLDPCNRSTGLFSCYIRGVFAFEMASVYNSTYLILTSSFSIYIKTKIKINNCRIKWNLNIFVYSKRFSNPQNTVTQNLLVFLGCENKRKSLAT